MAGKQKSKGEKEEAFWEGLAKGTLTVRLPSEAEWEKAARGVDGREFPWEGEFDPDKANVEMNVGHTSAVGCFPKGESPYGLQDLSGNVWEWTDSIYKEYPYDPADGREDLKVEKEVSRVLRGGAFNNIHSYARCACRGGIGPDFRDWDMGFRVVVGASPISGS
jgi:toxoflavin biosynthesis protein ToxD